MDRTPDDIDRGNQEFEEAMQRGQAEVALVREMGLLPDPDPFEGRWNWAPAWGMPEHFGLSYPALVLAVPRRHLRVDPAGPVLIPGTWTRFGGGRTWLAISAQTAGTTCDHPRFAASPLAIRPERASGIENIARRYFESNLGRYQVSIDEVNEYRQLLRDEVGGPVDCQWTYPDLAEAIYPIDATPEAIRWLTDEVLPEDLDDLVSDRLQVLSWRLYILTENSD